jgi:hypothetical protein
LENICDRTDKENDSIFEDFFKKENVDQSNQLKPVDAHFGWFLAVFMTLEIFVRFLFTFQRHHHGPSPPNVCLSLRSVIIAFCLWWLGRQLQSTATGRQFLIHSRYFVWFKSAGCLIRWLANDVLAHIPIDNNGRCATFGAEIEIYLVDFLAAGHGCFFNCRVPR